MSNQDTNLTCVVCGKPFKGSVRRRQVIWIRKVIRVAGQRVRVRGAVMASCNDKLNEMLVTDIV